MQIISKMKDVPLLQNIASGAKALNNNSAPHYIKRNWPSPVSIGDRESFGIMVLNSQNVPTYIEALYIGGLNTTIVEVSTVVKYALLSNAKSIIIFHNHPSGALKPSHADINITRLIKRGLEIFDIKLADHVIVTEEGYYSFYTEGLL